MSAQTPVLTRLRNWWNMGSFYNIPTSPISFSKKMIGAAARMRIYTREMEDFNWFMLMGRRNELKLAIARALDTAGKLPESGLILICCLDAQVSREFSGLKGPHWLEIGLPLYEVKFTKVMKINGFFFQSRFFRFGEPFTYAL